MLKVLKSRNAVLTAFILSVVICSQRVFESEIQASQNATEPYMMRCTCYTADEGDITASGTEVRDGIVAGKREWLGKVVVLYEVTEDGTMGDFIGYYEFKDTGYGINGSLINGTSIDVWVENEDAVWEWVGRYGDYVYMQLVDGKG